MVIVVNNKDGAHHHAEDEDVEGGQKMPAQPHRKVIIKPNENLNEPEGGAGDRRESSSSWASCEDTTPGESQISHESSKQLYDSTPNRDNGPKV